MVLRRHGIRRAATIAIISAFLLCPACSGSGLHEMRGILIDVQSRDLVNAMSLTLRDSSGGTHAFTVSPEVASNPEHPNTASHLRQHMAHADPVIVRYRTEAEGDVAVQVLDAAP